MARLQEFYKNTVVADLKNKFGYGSIMEVPRITKITLNMGVGGASVDKKLLEGAVADMQLIAVIYNIAKKVYFRFGKQALKWGRCYLWTPTDLLSEDRKSFADMEARLDKLEAR